jgi:homocysteine S-methyltransferase
MLEFVSPFIQTSPLPVLMMPNAGVPQRVSDRTLYLTSPEYFGSYARRFVEAGVRAVGGCCGTGPEHIAEAVRLLKAGEKGSLVIESLQVEVGGNRRDRDVKPEQTAPRPLGERSLLGQKLAEGRFVTSVELVPPMGYELSKTVERARCCAEAGVDAINIPDGPRASSRVSPMVTAMRIQADAGIEAVLHVTCRDRNIIGVQSDLLGCAAAGIHNLLIVTGDPPKLGDYPFATAVFDLDSIGLTRAAAGLNGGLDIAGKRVEPSTYFVIGVGADPTGLDQEREISRFVQKARAGADFAITQPVYDTRALLNYIERVKDTGVRIIAGIWPLASYNNALFMNNEVPGVNIPEHIMERMRKASGKDEARRVGIETARELLTAVRPHISGVQVSAPLGNVEIALEVLKDIL